MPKPVRTAQRLKAWSVMKSEPEPVWIFCQYVTKGLVKKGRKEIEKKTRPMKAPVTEVRSPNFFQKARAKTGMKMMEDCLDSRARTKQRAERYERRVRVRK